jgi:multidrug efflux pump subunit AcrB
MITSHEYGLIAELIAAALVIAALTGLFVQRSKPWMIGVTIPFVILTVAATVVIASST